MSERELQNWVVSAAHLLGWRAYHARAARTKHGWRTAGSYDSQGFPDLCLVRDRVVFAELKVGYRKPTPEQAGWLEALEAAGCEVYLWSDEAWTSGRIEAVLR